MIDIINRINLKGHSYMNECKRNKEQRKVPNLGPQFIFMVEWQHFTYYTCIPRE